MTVEILISTLNEKNIKNLIKKMNIQTDAIVINQSDEDSYEEFLYNDNKIRVFNCTERGLSRSRNLAIKNSCADICVLADDDMKYIDGFEEVIKENYKKNKNADIIAFAIGGNNKKIPMNSKKINYITSMKIQSVQVTFLRKKIKKSNLKFSEEFGAGAKYYMGEENIFLFDCLRNKLKIYNVSEKIADLLPGESTWFKGYNKDYFKIKGAVFYRMSKIFSPILILQFGFRKIKKYKQNISLLAAIKYMFLGIHIYRKEKK